MKNGKTDYISSGVNYSKVDPLKKLAQKLANSTNDYSSIKVIQESRGESAFVWEENDCYRAFVIEGLGTKNLIADEMRKITGKTYYDQLAQDTIAMIVNDLIVVGAKPQVINAYFAAGSSEWFEDNARSKDLTEGWAKACKLAGAVWGGGESPPLKDVVVSQAIDLAGSAIGIIKPKKRLTLGSKIEDGDSIILIESSGIHSNGLTLTRELVKKLPNGYKTELENGQLFGEELLEPTHIYVKVINSLFKENINIHYMINITGHGWRKIMRANQEFSYIIDTIPKPQTIFEFVQKHGGLSDNDMYQTFNMGAGFALIIDPKDKLRTLEIIKRSGLKSLAAGYVKKGERKVVIEPKNIVFGGETLNLR